MTHTTTHQAPWTQTASSQPSPAQAEGQVEAPGTTEPEAAPATPRLSEVVAALREHEAQDAEQQRRAEQAALHARQRFD